MTELTKDEAVFVANLVDISQEDRAVLLAKNRDYGQSWKRRGGTGAFMMLARKWDRIENMVTPHGYDIFKVCAANTGDVMDDVRDLRRYLLLVEEELMRQKQKEEAVKDRADGNEGMPTGIFREVALQNDEREQANMRAHAAAQSFSKSECDVCHRKLGGLEPMAIEDAFCFQKYFKCYECTKKSIFEEDWPALDREIEAERSMREHAASIRSQGS